MSEHARKRCNGCGVIKPWTEYYAKTKWPDGTMRQPHSRCKDCHQARNRSHPEARIRYDRKRYQQLRRDPEAWAARLAYLRGQYARLSSDPEWHTARMVQVREAKRRRNGITPDRYRDGVRPEGRVDTAPIRDAVMRSGLTPAEIEARIGGTDGTVRKALLRDTMALEKACRILDALDILPVELGL